MMTNTLWTLARQRRSWAAGLLAALITSGAVAAPVYRVIDLGAMFAHGSSVSGAINAQGDVVGGASPKKDLLQPVLFGKGKPLNLIAESGVAVDGGYASAINGDGHIAGDLIILKGDKRKPFVYRQGAMEVVEGGPQGNGLFVDGLSDLGHLLVSIPNKSSSVRQPDGTWVALKPWSGSSEERGLAINRQDGVVVGYVFFKSNYKYQAVVWRNGEPQLVPGTEGYRWSTANAINDRGDIAGQHSIDWGNGVGGRAFVVRDGVPTELTRPYLLSSATGMDNLGRVVGHMSGSFDRFYREGAFLFQDGEAMFLDDLIEPAQQGQWQIMSANAINDAGEIAARGRSTITGIERALKLVPVTAR